MEPILRNQIERLAPWPVEKALFAYEVADDAGEPGTLAVQLTVTGRNVVEGLVAELDSLGYAPDIVDCGTDAAPEPRLNLLPRQSAEANRIRQGAGLGRRHSPAAVALGRRRRCIRPGVEGAAAR